MKQKNKNLEKIYQNAIKNESFNKAINIFENYTKIATSESIFFNLGFLYDRRALQRKNYKRKHQDEKSALTYYKRAFALNKKFLPAILGLTRIYSRWKNPRAFVYAKKLYKITKDKSYYVYLGHVYHLFGKLKRAEFYYKKALPLISQHYGIYYALSILYQEMGKVKLSQLYAKKSINVFKKMSKKYKKSKVVKKYIQKLNLIIKNKSTRKNS